MYSFQYLIAWLITGGVHKTVYQMLNKGTFWQATKVKVFNFDTKTTSLVILMKPPQKMGMNFT